MTTEIMASDKVEYDPGKSFKVNIVAPLGVSGLNTDSGLSNRA